MNLSLDGAPITCNIHTLVAREFLQNTQNKPYVDHCDGDKTNNHLSNLRYATRSQNGGNSCKTNLPRSSRFKGVTWHKRTSKWLVRIMIEGKHISLGYFSNELEAARAYDNAAKANFEEFALLNFPEER